MHNSFFHTNGFQEFLAAIRSRQESDHHTGHGTTCYQSGSKEIAFAQFFFLCIQFDIFLFLFGFYNTTDGTANKDRQGSSQRQVNPDRKAE